MKRVHNSKIYDTEKAEKVWSGREGTITEWDLYRTDRGNMFFVVRTIDATTDEVVREKINVATTDSAAQKLSEHGEDPTAILADEDMEALEEA